jgi:hypothetical protein
MGEPDFPSLIHKLFEPIPQYVLGCLPAIAIMGESPMNKFTEKLAWVLRCLGCPFIGLFYTINVGSKKSSRCIYWLSSNHFINAGTPLQKRPFGFHHMKMEQNQRDVETSIERCTATASVLERLSSLISVYYIVVGVIAGISRAIGTVYPCESWPYIPLLLSWTIPAILRRAFSGNLVVKDPNEEFNNAVVQITMNKDPQIRTHKYFTVTTVAMISIIYPWITVLLAYFTPPVGYFCRSKFATIICAIWSFNSILAFICHIFGENNLIRFGKGIFHAWFSICGLIVAFLLFFLGLFAKNNKWWVDVFGSTCDVSSIGCH